MHKLIAVFSSLLLFLPGFPIQAAPTVSTAQELTISQDENAPFVVENQKIISRTPVGRSETFEAQILATKRMTLTSPNLQSQDTEYGSLRVEGTCPPSKFYPTVLQAGDVCKVIWTIKPAKMQSASAGPSFTAQEIDDNGNPVGFEYVSSIDLDLQSTVLTFNPVDKIIDFGVASVGSSAERDLLITNESTIDATVRILLDSPLFVLENGVMDQTFVIAAGETVAVPMEFFPRSEGAERRWADLAYKLNDGSPEQRRTFIILDGQGQSDETSPAVTVTDADFGQTTVGNEKSAQITIHNNAKVPVYIRLSDLEALAASGVNFPEGASSFLLSEGEEIVLDLGWNPRVSGPLSETLVVEATPFVPGPGRSEIKHEVVTVFAKLTGETVDTGGSDAGSDAGGTSAASGKSDAGSDAGGTSAASGESSASATSIGSSSAKANGNIDASGSKQDPRLADTGVSGASVWHGWLIASLVALPGFILLTMGLNRRRNMNETH